MAFSFELLSCSCSHGRVLISRLALGRARTSSARRKRAYCKRFVATTVVAERLDRQPKEFKTQTDDGFPYGCLTTRCRPTQIAQRQCCTRRRRPPPVALRTKTTMETGKIRKTKNDYKLERATIAVNKFIIKQNVLCYLLTHLDGTNTPRIVRRERARESGTATRRRPIDR